MITNHERKRMPCTAEGILRRNERIREIESYRNTAFSLKNLAGYSRDINIGLGLDTKVLPYVSFEEGINARFFVCLWDRSEKCDLRDGKLHAEISGLAN